MMPIKHLAIAVIGDDDLVRGLRLAGISRYHVIEDVGDTAKRVREALNKLVSDPGVGVIVILENYMEHVTDLVARNKQENKMTPIIVEVPSKYGTIYRDIGEYYRVYIREFIGVDVEI